MKKIKEIAQEIKNNWKPVGPGAKPYLEAMLELETIDDYYYCDSAQSIIAYFLSNASTWRGEVARRIKTELKSLLS